MTTLTPTATSEASVIRSRGAEAIQRCSEHRMLTA